MGHKNIIDLDKATSDIREMATTQPKTILLLLDNYVLEIQNDDCYDRVRRAALYHVGQPQIVCKRPYIILKAGISREKFYELTRSTTFIRFQNEIVSPRPNFKSYQQPPQE